MSEEKCELIGGGDSAEDGDGKLSLMRKPVFGVCNKKMRRPVCASAQTDQRLIRFLQRTILIHFLKVKFHISS